MGNCLNHLANLFVFVAVITVGCLCCPPMALSKAASQCARVKIEVKQELTLERQAFDAHMKINNGLTHAPLGDIQVDVWFTDEAGDPVLASSDPNNTSALFFIQVDSLDNISDVSGTGSVPADSSADIHWLIIPSPGASNGLASGTLYNVGAKLTYTVGGEENVIAVSPDYIFVKPMPELILDYFLPKDVYGDDAFTPSVEPAVPFSLGLRVKNAGSGTVNNLKIDSAQPKIVDNDQGLLVNFKILGSEVNGLATPESLLVDFGVIGSGASGTARWTMECTLSGKFVDFGASFSHADELGGELTSLIDQVNTHILVRDVLVDLPGRDDIQDFLAGESGVYEVYESGGTQGPVTDRSGAAALVFKEDVGDLSAYTLTAPPTAGFVFISLSDPHGGAKLLKAAVRSDGRTIKPANAWLSKTRDADTQEWNHFVNLFDADTTGTYTLVFDTAASAAQKPVLQFIPDRSVIESQTLSFLVAADDPNGTLPSLSADPRPVGALFTDSGNGQGIFEWTPQPGQKGSYFITFTASDGSLETGQQVKITVFDQDDSDMDGMPDGWEILYFGSISRDDTKDYDNDGVPDLQEYLDQTDPTLDEAAPSVPDPLYPDPNVAVADPTPELVIENSADPQNDAIDYTFQIYTDPQMTHMVADQDGVAQATQVNPPPALQGAAATAAAFSPPPGVTTTSWEVPMGLADNTRYYWRVRSSDVDGSSLWAYYDFFVNTHNDPPAPFQGAAPSDGAQVDSLLPTLTVMNAKDPDLDGLTYTFRVYEDPAMTLLAVESAPIPQGGGTTTAWTVGAALADNTHYFWQATASDNNGGQAVSPLVSFSTNTANQAPAAPAIVWPGMDEEIDTHGAGLQAGSAADPENDALTCLFEIDTSPAFDSPGKQVSGPVPAGAGGAEFYVDNLLENQAYYWRVKAHDGQAESPWATGRFFVNRINDAPSMPTVKNPGEDAWVDTLTPVLSLHASTDPDNDPLEYQFEIFSDPAMNHVIAQAEAPLPDVTVSPALDNNTACYWRARALDHHGVPSPWTPLSRFFVKDDTVNVLPAVEILQPFEDVVTHAQTFEIQWDDTDPDSSAQLALYYDDDAQGEDGVLIISGIEEDPDGTQDSYTWDISGLAEGTYHIYAVITDQAGSASHYGAGSITIDRTPQVSDITLNLTDHTGAPLTHVAVHLFRSTGPYAGLSSQTDDQGNAAFDPDQVPQDTYKFRIDILEHYFWTDTVQLPQQMYTAHMIPFEAVDITVTSADGPSVGNNVYLYSESGKYLGVAEVTDSQGKAAFLLPVGVTYKFRADMSGSTYWTDPVTIQAGDTNVINLTSGGGLFTVILQKDESTPMPGIQLYLFGNAGNFLGQGRLTDADGKAAFAVSQGDYQVRADYLGHEFWTDLVAVAGDTTYPLTLAHTDVTLTVSTLFQSDAAPLEGVSVHLFNPSGTYLGQDRTTDADGRVTFSLPNAAYKVEVNYMNRMFPSQEFTSTDTPVDIAMAKAQVAVTGAGQPQAGVMVHLFSTGDAYLGRSLETGAGGSVEFYIPKGTYKFRADYGGGEFWSPETGLAAHMVTPVALSVGGGAFVCQAQKDTGEPLAGAKIHVFTPASDWTGIEGTTGPDGQAPFDLADGTYLFRLDYLGHQFWSDPVSVPAQVSHLMTLAHSDVRVDVSTRHSACEVATLFLFSESGDYLGQYATTDPTGTALFNLPVGSTFKFQARVLENIYWSDVMTVSPGDADVVDLDIGGGLLTVTLQTGDPVPIPDATLHLFLETGTYTGQQAQTDAQGRAIFDLPQGNYKIRADYRGYEFWSDPKTVTDDTALEITLPHTDVTVTIQAEFQAASSPLAGVTAHLFSSPGTWQGQSAVTGANGQVTFSLPDQPYKILADYMKSQFWTDPFTSADTTLAIPHGMAGVHATQAGTDLAGAKVHLFKADGTYLELWKDTDTEGTAEFSVPAGQDYKLRVDTTGQETWTAPFTITADQTTTIDLEVN